MLIEDEKRIVIPLKSVVMVIGPSGAGKTFFIKNILLPQIKFLAQDANMQILSSDNYRREILGKELEKTDFRMNYASEGAFKLMESKFDAVTTWPITADFVILDATFIGREIREQFVEKAKKAQYQLVGFLFDFNDREEYFKYITDSNHRRLISEHLKRFHKELGEIGRKDFDYFYKIKSKDFDLKLNKDYSYDLMKMARLPENKSYFIVGDLHGCLKEFKELLTMTGFEIVENKIKGKEDTLIILIGDIVDKGNEVSELIDFIDENLNRIKICEGNHDRYLEKFTFKGIEKLDAKVEKYYDSAKKLSPEKILKFKAIMEKQSPFYIHDHFVITHAPCENKYIGKFDNVSFKKQRNDLYPKHDDFDSEEEYLEAFREHYSFFANDAKRYNPYHIFGHIALTNYLIIENKIFLDTGCAYGNKLTGLLIDNYGKFHFKSVQSSYPKNPFIVNGIIDNIIKNIKRKEVTFDSLEFKDKIDILQFSKNKVNFISGTMSPCSSNIKENTLENIREAFSYYRKNNIEKVILEKKYMGSRANMYLFPKDIEKSYMVSRNGFIIKRLNLKPLYEKMLNFFFDKKNSKILDSELVIIDGELLPWSVLGKSLIESHFMAVGKGAESELKLLEETGFEIALEDIKKKFTESEFKELKQIHKRKELINIMGENHYRQMCSFDNFKWIPIEEQRFAINIYNKQLDIYGKENKENEANGHGMEFKPFAILKLVRKVKDLVKLEEKSELKLEESELKEDFFWNCQNDTIFTMVSDDEYLVTSTDHFGLEDATKWFSKIIKENYEGVVIRPIKYVLGVAPYMKVRNPNYLTIIYGYDYLTEQKFTNMIENKHISKKLEMSIKEFEIGKRLLQIPYNEINENNKKYLNICAQMVTEEKKEKELDPKL